jgi:hypothetical protein
MEKENFEVAVSLMTHHIKDKRASSEELKESLNILHTIFFMRDQIELGIKREGIDYISTDDFNRVHRCIDANKVKLFKIIASL